MNVQDFPVDQTKFTLKRWRRVHGLSQAEVARRLTRLAPAVLGRDFPVSQSRVSDLEADTRPNRDLLLLVNVLTRGAVDANAFYELPDWRQWEGALRILEDGA